MSIACRTAAVIAFTVLSLPPVTNAQSQNSNATWREYMQDCGLEAQKTNSARTEKAFQEKYQGKVVNWTGKVYSVKNQLIGDGFMLDVVMKPTESKLEGSDLTLDVPGTMKDRMLNLNKGDKITFYGRFTSQGGAFTNHILKLERLSQ